MRKSEREQARARADLAKQRIRDRREQDRTQREQAAKAAAEALRTAPQRAAERVTKYLEPARAAFLRRLVEGPRAARKLVEVGRAALGRLGEVHHLRPLEEWVPQGKGRETLFRGLCSHLLAKYPTPPFLWSAFQEEEATAKVLVPLVVHVAAGGSLFQFSKAGGLPFALTRAQCAEFMKTDARYGVLDALRRVQVKAEGGDRHLFEIWRRLPRNRELQTPALEAFGVTVLRFLARNPMLAPTQIAPLCDYVYHRFRANSFFSMQGRTAAALLRDMEAWHRELNAAQEEARHAPVKFDRSGFKPHRLETRESLGRKGAGPSQIWTVNEILGSVELKAEGKALHHCVYSYRSQVVAGVTSIWSLGVVVDDGQAHQRERLVTLEVRNDSRTVVQARGVHNRSTTAKEDKIILEWASKNQLEIRYGKWW